MSANDLIKEQFECKRLQEYEAKLINITEQELLVAMALVISIILDREVFDNDAPVGRSDLLEKALETAKKVFRTFETIQYAKIGKEPEAKTPTSKAKH